LKPELSNCESEMTERSFERASENLSKSISESMNQLFSDDKGDITGKEELSSKGEGSEIPANNSKIIENDWKNQDTGKEESKESTESDVAKKNFILKQVEKSLSVPEGIRALIERHPEKAELRKNQLEAMKILNDADATPAEIRSAQAKLNNLKGQLLETAVKDALIDAGLDVEPKQRIVEGETGGTRPDVIAKNNTDNPLEVFDMLIEPGESLSIECKCGGSAYMTNQLFDHIPNQLSGQEGKKVLLTTSDINNTPPGLVLEVCNRYDAKLVIVGVNVADVENAIKEVAEI